MGQPCQEDPNDLDPTLGRPYLSPSQLEQQLEWLRTGRYRLSAVSARFGQTPNALYGRMRAHPELRERYMAAKAEGEMRQCDKLADAEDQLEVTKATKFLESVHGFQKRVDAARERQILQEIKEGRSASGGDLEQRKRLREFLAEASAVSEGDPTANAENAGEGA